MRIIVFLLLLPCLAISGCTPKPTVSEFEALKKADASLDNLAMLQLALVTGGEYGSFDKAKQAREDTRSILDGAIIRSPIGKQIRSNLREQLLSLSLLTSRILANNELILEVMERRARGERVEGDLERKRAEAKANLRKLLEDVQAWRAAAIKFEEEQAQLFNQMREQLEN